MHALLLLAAIVAVLSALMPHVGLVGLRARLSLLDLAGEAGELTLARGQSDAVKRQIKEKLEAAQQIAAKAESDDRDFTDEERTQVKNIMDEVGPLKERLKTAEGDDELRKSLADLGLQYAPSGGDGAKLDPGQLGKGDSLGERLTNSEEFQSWMKSFPNGRIPDSAKGIQSPAVSFAGLKELVIGGDPASAGALVTPQNLGLVDQGTWRRPLTLLDLVSRGQTGTDSVEYVRHTGVTNNAAPVAEATASGDGSGTKPESGMSLERITESVKTIAHWIPATKRALSDAAQIRTLIDNFLRYGLQEELEDQILTGDGLGENFTGILNTAGTQVQAWDTDLLVTTRRAKTKVRVGARAAATAYLFNPEDNERIDLMRDANGQFYFGGPSANGVNTLWGIPRVESEAIPAGTGLVADFRRATVWDREEAAIQASDSHADFFTRNMVAILAELRAAFGVLRPSAFVEITLNAPAV